MGSPPPRCTGRRDPIAEVVTGNVFVHTLISLDGFIAGPNDDMSWVFRHAGDTPSAVVDEVIARAGAVLGGRRVYEVGRRVQRPGKRGLFDASRLARDARRVGNRSRREPATASRQSSRVSTTAPGHSSGVWGVVRNESTIALALLGSELVEEVQ